MWFVGYRCLQTNRLAYWLSAARELGHNHPALARQLPPEALEYIKERKGNGALNRIRSEHHDLFVRFTAEIRRRSYAYRTEQSYEQWICRYLLFSNGNLYGDVVATKSAPF